MTAMKKELLPPDLYERAELLRRGRAIVRRLSARDAANLVRALDEPGSEEQFLKLLAALGELTPAERAGFCMALSEWLGPDLHLVKARQKGKKRGFPGRG